MTAIWLLVLATGVTPFQPGNSPAAKTPAAATAAQQTAAADSPAAMPVSPAAATVDPAARTPQQLREAVAAVVRQLNASKKNERIASIMSALDLYRELARDQQLTPQERNRLAAQLRARLQRSAAQLHYELVQRCGCAVRFDRGAWLGA